MISQNEMTRIQRGGCEFRTKFLQWSMMMQNADTRREERRIVGALQQREPQRTTLGDVRGGDGC